MKILINLENSDDFREIQIELTDSLETLKYILEAEFSIPFLEQDIKFDAKPLINDQEKISTFKISENDIIILAKKPKNQSSLASVFDETMKLLKQNKPIATNLGNSGFSSGFNEKLAFDLKVKQETKEMRDHYSKSPGDLAVLFNTDPKFAEAICAGDDLFLEDFIRKRMEKYMEQRKKKGR
jgi:hypothetical protein